MFTEQSSVSIAKCRIHEVSYVKVVCTPCSANVPSWTYRILRVSAAKFAHLAVLGDISLTLSMAVSLWLHAASFCSLPECPCATCNPYKLSSINVDGGISHE